MRVCQIVPSLAERHGGPSKSVRALAAALARAGDDVELLATSEPGETVDLAAAAPAVTRIFPRVPPRSLARSPELRRHLAAAALDCVHYHSLWLRPLHYAVSAARQRQRPLVVSPRGMLSGWAYRHHHWRKQLAAAFVHPGALAAATGWHATSPEEADDIRALGFRQPVCVASNGVVPPTAAELATARAAWRQLCPAIDSRPVALFYSRFHRKKRVRELIDLWCARPRGDWLLLVVGTAEEYSAAELAAQAAAAKAGADSVAVFDGAGRPPPYAAASLFLLPSRSENFGLVIAEALAAGVPALVTDATPWSALGTVDAGWCVPWARWDSQLSAALALSAEDLTARGRRGRAWVERDFSWSRAADLLREFYASLRG